MNKDTNIKKLKKYLFGFLLNDRNNGKIVMLSGAWGAGKTYFWQNKMEAELLERLKDDNKACIYISLYGKDSLDSLKQEVFIKASSEKSLFSKEVSTFGIDVISSIKNSDLVVGKLVKSIDNINNHRKNTKGKNRLKDGGIVCFDDFERKSKQIDLNDLFGFISQLALEYKCKVVIILNSDVFKEEEAKVFSNVKEKTVNKFLKFNPSKKELFETIFSLDKKYKEVLLKSILEMDILNARVYKNVFENFEELIEKYPNLTESEIRFFVLSLINFNFTHKIFKFYEYIFYNKERGILDCLDLPNYFFNKANISVELLNKISTNKDFNFKFELINHIKSELEIYYKKNSELSKKLEKELEVLDKYSDDIWNYWKLDKILNFRENVSLEMQKVINDFIERGYL